MREEDSSLEACGNSPLQGFSGQGWLVMPPLAGLDVSIQFPAILCQNSGQPGSSFQETRTLPKGEHADGDSVGP